MEGADLKEKTVLVYDYGLFSDLAASLTNSFKTVYYFCPWQDDFPSTKKQKIGYEFKGLERIQKFWDYVDRVDAIACFDTYCGDMVDYLKRKGYAVWGAGKSEMLELERWKMRKLQKEMGLATQPTIMLKSLQDLILYFKGIKQDVIDHIGVFDKDVAKKQLQYILQKYDDFSEQYAVATDKKTLMYEWMNGAQKKFVKSNFRGDIESFFAPNYHDSLSKFNHLTGEFGHRTDGKDIEFIIENSVEGLEPGFDGIVVNGDYLSPTLWGIEKKGSGYLGRVFDYKDLPPQMKEINDKFSILFKKLQPNATFFSTEFIVDKAEKAYLIDPSVRNPAPVGTAIFSEMYENLGEIIWNGAHGQTTVPKMLGIYGAGVCLESEWADKNELEVDVPPDLMRWVKFRKAYMRDGKPYAIPGFSSVCTVIAIGDSIDEVVSLVKERCEKVKAFGLGCDTSGLDKIVAELPDYEKLNFKL